MEILLENLMKIGRNQENFDRLVDQIKSPLSIIPFVGAGMSSPLYPLWGKFLMKMASETGMTDCIQELLNKGFFEEAAEKLLIELGERYFRDFLEDEFSPKKIIDIPQNGAVSILPLFARGPVITTNFDRLLEEVYQRAANPFKEKTLGAQAGMISHAIVQDNHYLIKLHGDVQESTSWILTLEQYESHYGQNKKVDLSLPLPKILKRLMSGGRSLLFLGCSLVSDRTIQIMAEITQEYKEIAHYAIVEIPDDEKKYQERLRFLSKHSIRPIWYPKDHHESLTILLQCLVAHKESESGSSIAEGLPVPPIVAQDTQINNIGNRFNSEGIAHITDVIVHQDAEGVCVLDFRVANHSIFEILVNRVTLNVIDVESIITLEYKSYSMNYDVDISEIKNKGDSISVSVCQKVLPRRTDRFSIKLGAKKLPVGEICYWKVQPLVKIDMNVMECAPVEVWLPVKLPLPIQNYRDMKVSLERTEDKLNY
jgi:hypothetical protein